MPRPCSAIGAMPRRGAPPAHGALEQLPPSPRSYGTQRPAFSNTFGGLEADGCSASLRGQEAGQDQSHQPLPAASGQVRQPASLGTDELAPESESPLFSRVSRPDYGAATQVVPTTVVAPDEARPKTTQACSRRPRYRLPSRGAAGKGPMPLPSNGSGPLRASPSAAMLSRAHSGLGPSMSRSGSAGSMGFGDMNLSARPQTAAASLLRVESAGSIGYGEATPSTAPIPSRRRRDASGNGEELERPKPKAKKYVVNK